MSPAFWSTMEFLLVLVACIVVFGGLALVGEAIRRRWF